MRRIPARIEGAFAGVGDASTTPRTALASTKSANAAGGAGYRSSVGRGERAPAAPHARTKPAGGKRPGDRILRQGMAGWIGSAQRPDVTRANVRA